MRKKRFYRNDEPEMLEHIYDKNGYQMVVLVREDGVQIARYIHELVAEAFIPNPTGKKYVHHIDGDITNNRADNLEWSDIPE